MCRLLRRDVLQFRAHGIDDLLLAHFPREIIPLGSDDVAIARIRQCPLSIEVLPSAREAVFEEIIVEAALTVDVDAAEVVDDFLEGGEIYADEGVDRLGENPADRVT